MLLLKKNFIASAFILTLSGLITKILGFFYRVYISNKMGPECIGLYQMILPIYTLAWSISCAGFTTSISKLIAQENLNNNQANSKRILDQACFISIFISLILNLILYFYSRDIALIFFKDSRIILSLKILSFGFIFMAWGSCIRGYFFGLQESLVPAISQVIEQLTHMLIIILFFNFIKHEIKYTCALAIAGVTLSELIATLFVYIIYKNKIKSFKKSRASLKFFDSLKLILNISLPLSANKIISSLLLTLENILIPQRLALNNFFNKELALNIYGKLTGMAMPLIYFPSVFLLSLAISLVPAVSQANIQKNKSRLNKTISKTILITSIISFFSLGFFFCFSHELGLYIYKQDLNYIIKSLSIICPFLYLQVILSGILNGLGYQVFIFKTNLLSSLINLFFIYYLIPKFNLKAYFFGWLLSLIISSLLSLNLITKNISIKLNFKTIILKPAISIFLTCYITKNLFYKLILSTYNNFLGLLILSCLLLIIYLSLIIYTGCFKLKDIKNLLSA